MPVARQLTGHQQASRGIGQDVDCVPIADSGSALRFWLIGLIEQSGDPTCEVERIAILVKANRNMTGPDWHH